MQRLKITLQQLACSLQLS